MADIDRFIAAMPAERDGDLMLCRQHGIAYQRDRKHIVSYDEAYHAKCRSYEGQDIDTKINAGRIALVNGCVGCNRVLDIGIGSGSFIKNRLWTWGIDVNPVAIEWLKSNELWPDRLDGFAGYTMWDVCEHVPDPEQYFREIMLGAYLFLSVPIFESLDRIRASKHYRPGEHLTYFLESGLISWLGMHGFLLVDRQTFEMEAGRESIYSYAFKRARWPK